MKGKCPFGKIKCEECVLYRRGLRFSQEHPKGVPFEECAINIAADCLENLVTRSIGQQKATEEVRNMFAAAAQIRMLKHDTED